MGNTSGWKGRVLVTKVRVLVMKAAVVVAVVGDEVFSRRWVLRARYSGGGAC